MVKELIEIGFDVNEADRVNIETRLSYHSLAHNLARRTAGLHCTGRQATARLTLKNVCLKTVPTLKLETMCVWYLT